MLLALWVVLALPALAQEVMPARVASEALAVQVMLDRAGFSPGEIDGRTGANVRRALQAFQTRYGLDTSGELDPATWARLVEVTGDPAPLAIYEITASDLAGPFTPRIPADLVKQAALPSLGYTSALEALSERFHASPELLHGLNPDALFDVAGERIIVPSVAPAAPVPLPDGSTPAAVTIAVTKATSALTIEDDTGTVLFHAPVTSGSSHDPLPIGRWRIIGVQRDPTFHYNPALFWDADPSHAKAVLPPGPNNPVGVAWIGIDKEHYGIHGTPEPSRIGHTQSHGCVRLTNWDIERVLQWARPGTPVVFR